MTPMHSNAQRWWQRGLATDESVLVVRGYRRVCLWWHETTDECVFGGTRLPTSNLL